MMSSFDKSVTWIICIFIIMFFTVWIVAFISTADVSITYNINMDNNTLEAFKSIGRGFINESGN